MMFRMFGLLFRGVLGGARGQTIRQMKELAGLMRFPVPKVWGRGDNHVVQSSKEHSKRYIYLSIRNARYLENQ